MKIFKPSKTPRTVSQICKIATEWEFLYSFSKAAYFSPIQVFYLSSKIVIENKKCLRCFRANEVQVIHLPALCGLAPLTA